MTRPRTLLMIRHGEKPSNHHRGVDEHGKDDPNGLVPRGWQRAGALIALFAPNGVTLNSGLPSPGALVTPKYAEPVHRPYLTLLPLSQRLQVMIQSDHAVDEHPRKIVNSLLAMQTSVVLVCWEHNHLVNIASAMAGTVPITNPGDVPTSWPDDQFDVIWRFDHDEQTGNWTFGSLRQQLLAEDFCPTLGPDRSNAGPSAGTA